MADADKLELLPETVTEATELLRKGFRPVAGGTDLIVRRHAMLRPQMLRALPGGAGTGRLFSCRRIPAARRIFTDDDRLSVGRRLHIGSCVTLAEIIDFKETPELLRQAVLSIAAPGIRNAATLIGNICNASPAADSLPALYVLNGEITCSDGKAERRIPLQDFITGPGKTVLRSDELVLSVSCELSIGENCIFRKVGTRAANALSKISIASLWKHEAGILSDFRIAVGACAPVIIRKPEIEKIITGTAAGADTDSPAIRIDKFLNEFEKYITPIDDQRSTAVYRKNTALRLLKDILLKVSE